MHVANKGPQTLISTSLCLLTGFYNGRFQKGHHRMLPGGGGHTLTPALAGVKGGDVLPQGFTLHSGRAPQPHAGDCWPDHG